MRITAHAISWRKTARRHCRWLGMDRVSMERPPVPADRALPLAGIRVVDLGMITAGAGTSTLLLDLGAEVVKVEGASALDSFRSWDGADPTTDWWNRSHQFAFTNRGKKSLCLDLKDARGREALLRLLESADVLVENFRRGVMASLGLDPTMLRRRFPRLVIASISSQGETGPDRDMVSYGSTLEATGGLAALTGGAAAPVITGRAINYPDQVVCLFASGAVVAALLERDRTGHGAHLDLSQRELTSFLIGEEMIAAAAGAPWPRPGEADPAGRVVVDGAGERVEWPGGSAPIRDGAALIAAREFAAGTAIMHGPDGSPAKGIPFRFTTRPLAVREPRHTLGADNRAVLRGAGFGDDAITALESAGLLATAPRK
jgi:benzylsuccinate CoA-transferase BbsF subunit